MWSETLQTRPGTHCFFKSECNEAVKGRFNRLNLLAVMLLTHAAVMRTVEPPATEAVKKRIGAEQSALQNQER
jgi:hypothetical protein